MNQWKPLSKRRLIVHTAIYIVFPSHWKHTRSHIPSLDTSSPSNNQAIWLHNKHNTTCEIYLPSACEPRKQELKGIPFLELQWNNQLRFFFVLCHSTQHWNSKTETRGQVSVRSHPLAWEGPRFFIRESTKPTCKWGGVVSQRKMRVLLPEVMGMYTR